MDKLRKYLNDVEYLHINIQKIEEIKDLYKLYKLFFESENLLKDVFNYNFDRITKNDGKW